MVDLTTSICGWKLDNPVIPASGCFGYGKEFADFYDLNILGTFSFKGTTVNERYGNDTPRIAESEAGVINCVGLQNPGIEHVIKHEIPEMESYFSKKVIANISGHTTEEFVHMAGLLNSIDKIGAIEVNISCPNIKGGGLALGTDPEKVMEITSEVKKVTKKIVIMKLSPSVTDISLIAKACEAAGADAISLINTMTAMQIDLKTKKPVLSQKTGGLSGPAVFPIALALVYRVYEAVKIPIIGLGGVKDAEGVLKMMLAGASAVQVGAANLIDPFICKNIIDALPETMEKYGIQSLSEIIGKAH